MKKLILILFLLPNLFFSQGNYSISEEVEKFAMNVVKAIIEHDCDAYYNSINDSVVLYMSVNDTIIEKKDIESQLKMLCQISIKNDSMDFDYYKKNFDQQFVEAKTLADKEFYGYMEQVSTLGSLEYYKIEEGDIFFVGAYHKTLNHLDFIMDDAFKFIIRQVNGEFKIILITN